MDEDGIVDRVNRNNEKKSEKKSKKDKKLKNSAMGIEEVRNTDMMETVESAGMSEEEGVSEVKRDHKRDKEEKRKKKDKNKVAKGAEADLKNDSKESELTVVFGDNESKKGKFFKKSVTGIEEVHNAVRMDTVESAQMFEEEGVSEVQRDHKRDKDEKRKKKDKNKGAKDAEAGLKSELTVVFGDNGGGQEMDNAAIERKKREKKKNKSDRFEMHGPEEVKRGESIHCQEGGSVSRKEVVEEKKKKKKVKKNNIKEGEKDGEVTRALSENCMVNVTEIRKKRKKDEKKSKDDNNVPEIVEDHTQVTEEDGEARKKKKHKKKDNFIDDMSAASDTNSALHASETQKSEAEHAKKRKKEKTKISENEAEYANKGKKRKTSLVVNSSDGSHDTSPNKSNKKVRFSGQDEVFSIPSNSNTEWGNVEEKDMVRGKRFTREEDEIVKAAVMKYVEDNELGEEGVDMILNCNKHPELKRCWKKITPCLPYRPHGSVYCRARILFMRSEKRQWTQEEKDIVLKYQQEHGNKWKALADELGKHRWHVKDTWRRIKLPNLKKGHWSQDEYQKLFDLVNTDLQLKVSEEKTSKHGMLRDNIAWSAISDELSTRTVSTCCIKWYNQLTSSMVVKGVWADTDDYRLIGALYSLDATCVEDVEWDDLIETRSGDLCRKRWNQMSRHVGNWRKKSFAEQVEVLAKRYCPHLLEAREIWDNKPRVP